MERSITQPRFWKVVLALALSFGGRLAAQPEAEQTLDVRSALAARYPRSSVTRVGNLEFDTKTPIEPVQLPALARALPGVRFFLTKLHTGYYEYDVLSVAVAALVDGPIAVNCSPLYSAADPAFTELLTRAQASGADGERAVAEEIARLFASIMDGGGEIRASRLQGGTFTAELWTDSRYYRRVTITFANGRVLSVTLTNPKDQADPPAGKAPSSGLSGSSASSPPFHASS